MIATAATGVPVCEITADGVQPHDLSGVERKIRDYVKGKKKDELIVASNYILSAMEERRLPTRAELDDWGGGRPIVNCIRRGQ